MNITKVNAISLLAICICFLALYQYAADKTGYMAGGQVFDGTTKQPIPMLFKDNGDGTFSPSNSSSLSTSGTASDTSGTITSGTLNVAAGSKFIEVFPAGATPSSASMNVVTTGTITVSGSNYGAFIRTAPTGMVLSAYSFVWTSGTFNYGVLRP